MSALERDLIGALVADPDGAIDAADDDTLSALAPVMADRVCRSVVTAVVALVGQGRAPLPERLVRVLVAEGWERGDAVDAVMTPGAFEARGCRVQSVADAVVALRVERRLAQLADALYRPGGVAKVAAALGVAA